MKRTPMKRRTPMRDGPTAPREAKPRADAGPKAKPCEMCRRDFLPRSSFATCCSQRCAMRKVKRDNEARAKREKAEIQARKDAIKKLSELTEECRKIVQKIARIRDRHDGCISCHLPATWDGQWHGSHYRPAGNHSAVELHLWNIHKSCSSCNRHKGGNIAGYTPRLIAKIGQERVDWLNAQNHTVKRSREYLMRFKKVMGKRARRLEKAARKEGQEA